MGDRVKNVYEAMEQAMRIGQLRNKFNLKKGQLVKVLDKMAKLTNVLVNHASIVLGSIIFIRLLM